MVAVTGAAGDLAVRISDGTNDRHVTRHVSGLRISETAPGGFYSCDFRLDVHPDLFPDLGPADKVYVYDTTAEVVFEGLIDNPGRTDGRDGTGLDIHAYGTAVVAGDRRTALPYLERDLTAWEQAKASTTAPSADAGPSDDPTADAGGDTEQGLLLQFNPGQPVGPNSLAQIGYTALAEAGMELGSITFRVKDGKTDPTGYKAQYRTSAGVGTSVVQPFGTGLSTTPRGPFPRYVGAPWAAGSNRVALELRRLGGATNLNDDDTWSWFYDIAVAARRMHADGTLLSSAESSAQGASAVRADWIVNDVLGRLLAGQVDAASSVVEAADWMIDQLSFPDAVTATEVFDALELWEPDFVWAMYESQPGRGYRVTYRRWDTTPRYDISTRDGYSAPGADIDLCNQISVEWTDLRGVRRTETINATSADYPDLAALEFEGRVRQAEPVVLEDGLGSKENAMRIGAQVLAIYATVPVAGTALVRRPVRDLLCGGWVQPHQIKAGFPVLVRDLGQVLRCTQSEYDHDSRTATLTLGTPVRTREQRIARLSRRR